MKRTILLALLLACGVAQAAEWLAIMWDGDDRSHSYIDVSSIKVYGDLRTARFKTEFPPKTKRGRSPNSDRFIKSMVALTSINCRTDQFSIDSGVYYFFGGGSQSRSHAPSRWVAIPPESYAEAQKIVICSFKTQ